MKILVTGGAGFIGSNFCHYCYAHEPSSQIEKIIVIDKLGYSGSIENISELMEKENFCFIQADICNQELITQLLFDEKIDAVIHFAAESHVDRSIDDPAIFVQSNVVGTFKLLESSFHYFSSLAHKDKEKFRFLHISTDEVYGSIPMDASPAKEGGLYAPSSPYSASKAASDHFVWAYYKTYGLPAMITHSSNNYGPRQHPEKMIPHMICNALEGKELPVYGLGLNIRDWIYVEDHCAGIWRVLCWGKQGEVYHIGKGSGISNIELVRKICSLLDIFFPRLTGKSYSELIRFVADRPGHDLRYALDVSKMKKELGWEAQMELEKGLEKTIFWYVEHKDWIRSVMEKGYALKRQGLYRKAKITS
ncbi:dTDP-glucose 4,6-dehydratase [Methylacidiphilum caldifontis]|uniref:dTDP-glucose 4,6-dehydratase n=1 Tax=Methylacidiphilum caldifontis TaxID=2795386 RepID=A0A4Y8PC20_9BACT|nr:dTDP-glucose 4,6-dehydratase [Methylacidiphilum caldifontis]QSR87969.1 dTDP-glucose 4,6-dehydratase [Methylacidiphilum caldifontis]TFE68729.1 dTDP-glucose 4,6-dehydratase [Methylacidiphilum caldifontis]